MITLNPPYQAQNFMSQSTFNTDDTEIFATQLTDTLVTSGKEEQEDNHSEDDSKDFEDYDSKDTIDNIV